MNYYVYNSNQEFEFDTYDLNKALQSAYEIDGRVTDEFGNEVE